MCEWRPRSMRGGSTAAMACLVVSVWIIIAAVGATAASGVAELFPNQQRVFASGHWWPHVLNNTWRGGGGLNTFGLAMEAAGWQWTAAVCGADSDGDGFTNGEELGDPACAWVPGGGDAAQAWSDEEPASHPGLASSVPMGAAPRVGAHVAACPLDLPIADVPALGGTERLASRMTTPLELPSGLMHGTRFAEVAAVPRPAPDAFAAEDRAACPHLQPGLRHWHDASVWPGGQLPSAGASVMLPNTTRVLISACSLPSAGFAAVTVPATSELVFADAPVHLVVKDLVVRGRLVLGSEACPLHSPITITFVATKAERATYSNGIMVEDGGALHAWGTRSAVTWTRLAATARRRSRVLLLQDTVDWGVGEELVVTTSVWRDLEDNQNEVRRIAAISADGRTLVLDRALNHSHYGGAEYQCEVGLLTRSIVLRGWTNGYADAYGGHTMAAGLSTVYQVVGVQARRMGQRNLVARYPFHLHLMMEAGERATMQQLACRDCYYRCAVIHKTNSTVLRKSVAFNVSGHTYYLEEGAEMNNTIDFNLAAYVHPIGAPAAGGAQGGEDFVEDDAASQPADHTAAGFYIPNPANDLIGNAASGGWSGFSFPIFPRPILLSRNVAMEPHKYALGRFDGNSAHSSGYFWGDGGCIYFGGRLWEDAGTGLLRYSNGRFEHKTYWWPHGEQRPAWHNITNMRTWLCQKGLSSWGDRIDITDFESYDCTRSAVLFGQSSIRNMLVVGTSANNPADMETTGRQGFQFYDTWVLTILSNVTFRNFHVRRDERRWSTNGVIVDLTHSDIFKPWSISATRGLRFENVDQALVLRRWVRETGASRMFNFVDWDGSVVGDSNCVPYVIGSELPWWAVDDTCFYRDDWRAYICPRQPGREPVGLDMVLPGLQEELDIRTGNDDELTPEQRYQLYIGHISQFGPRSDRQLIITRNRHLATGLSGMGWYMYVKFGMPLQIRIEPINFPRGSYIVLAISYPPGTTFRIWSENRWGFIARVNYTQVASAQAVADSNGTSYHFDGHRLFLKVLDFWIDYPRSYARDGVGITRASQAGFITVDAQCAQMEGGRCAPPPAPEPPAAELTYPVTPCADEDAIVAPMPPLCPHETSIPPSWFDGDCFAFRTMSSCRSTDSAQDCLAYCKPGCHMFLRPYTCSWQPQCDAARKPPVLRPWCEWLNDDVRADTCFIASCNYSSNATIRLPLPTGSPCQIGDGLDGRCLGSGACRAMDAQLDPHNIECATATSEVVAANELTFTGPAPPADGAAAVTAAFADGTTLSGDADYVLAAGGAAPFFRFDVGGAGRVALVRNVSVRIGDAEREFRDWHGTIGRVPQVKLLCRNDSHWHVAVRPQSWIDAALLEDEANTTQRAAARRDGEGFVFDVQGMDAGELRVRLVLGWGGTVVRTFPCHGAGSIGQVCHGPATTVRGIPTTCALRVVDRGSNAWWVSLEVSPMDGVVEVTVEDRDLSLQWGAFSGGVSQIVESRNVTVKLSSGATELFRITREMLELPGDLECVRGTLTPSATTERGPQGACAAVGVCAMPGFAVGAPPADSCVEAGAPPTPTASPPPPPAPSEPAVSPPAMPDSPADAPSETAPPPPAADDSPSTATDLHSTASASAPAAPAFSPPPDPSPTAAAPLRVTGWVRLRGEFARAFAEHFAALREAVKSDLRRILALSATESLEVTNLSLGSLLVEFEIVGAARESVVVALQAARALSLSGGSGGATDPHAIWTDTDALLQTAAPAGSSSSSSVVLDDYSTDGEPARSGGERESCSRGCVVLAAVSATVFVCVVAVLALLCRKRGAGKSEGNECEHGKAKKDAPQN